MKKLNLGQWYLIFGLTVIAIGAIVAVVLIKMNPDRKNEDILLAPKNALTATVKIEIKDYDTTRCRVLNPLTKEKLRYCPVMFFGSAINQSCPGPQCAAEPLFFIEGKSIWFKQEVPVNWITHIAYINNGEITTKNLYIDGIHLETIRSISLDDQSYMVAPFMVRREVNCKDDYPCEYYNIVEPLDLPPM